MSDKSEVLTNPVRKTVDPIFASMDDAIEAIRKNLTDDLLKPEYKENDRRHPMFGHCFVATEALYHLTGKKYGIYCGKDDEGITHWWLQDALGQRYDPTADQYTDLGKQPPYHNGKKSGFMLTYNKGEPSNRCKVLLERILS